ncbi:hypothetical protein CEXT_569111, partial [Caerostris extrusa]
MRCKNRALRNTNSHEFNTRVCVINGDKKFSISEITDNTLNEVRREFEKYKFVDETLEPYYQNRIHFQEQFKKIVQFKLFSPVQPIKYPR